ncbi:unnamed protein product [Vitrella brassicaformis CCMP3155]|uniref:C3H1-type domain-containing protein n=1 Tax=Vitrella brassicaformis (strain CCMP3155) TaxID=1169540 RepID=A0A0G4EQ96_VITBC|nr:unnamed protein product [Vitrella brassicaformis CCMP3155]|eukprot:CEL99789.1 unnamed protein product [Vitrella brassicaformis CCMP3155]
MAEEGGRNGERQVQENSLLYKTVICKHWQEGKCARGAKCTYAHGEEELRTRPDLRKTRLCRGFMNGTCTDAKCLQVRSRPEGAEGGPSGSQPPVNPASTAASAAKDPMAPPNPLTAPPASSLLVAAPKQQPSVAPPQQQQQHSMPIILRPPVPQERVRTGRAPLPVAPTMAPLNPTPLNRDHSRHEAAPQPPTATANHPDRPSIRSRDYAPDDPLEHMDDWPPDERDGEGDVRSLPPSLDRALTAHDGIYRSVIETLTGTYIELHDNDISVSGGEQEDDVTRAFRYMKLLMQYVERGAASLKESDNTGNLDFLPVHRDIIRLVMGEPAGPGGGVVSAAAVRLMRECGCLLIPGKSKESRQRGIAIFGANRRDRIAAQLRLMRLVESSDHPAALGFSSARWTGSRHSRRDELAIDRIQLSDEDLHVFRRMGEGRMAALTRRIARASRACGVERVADHLLIGGMYEERRAAIAYLRLQGLWEQGKDGDLWRDLRDREDVLLLLPPVGAAMDSDDKERLADSTGTLVFMHELSGRVAIVSVDPQARQAAAGHRLLGSPSPSAHMDGHADRRANDGPRNVHPRRRHEETEVDDWPGAPDEPGPADRNDEEDSDTRRRIADLEAELAQVEGEIRREEGLTRVQQQKYQRASSDSERAQQCLDAAEPDIDRLEPLLHTYRPQPFHNLSQSAVDSERSHSGLRRLRVDVCAAIEEARRHESRARRAGAEACERAEELARLREHVEDKLGRGR